MSEVTIAFWVGLVVGTLEVYLMQYLAELLHRRKMAKRLRETDDRLTKSISDALERNKRLLERLDVVKALRQGEAQIVCRECGNLNSFVGQDLPFVCSKCGEVLFGAPQENPEVK